MGAGGALARGAPHADSAGGGVGWLQIGPQRKHDGPTARLKLDKPMVNVKGEGAIVDRCCRERSNADLLGHFARHHRGVSQEHCANASPLLTLIHGHSPDMHCRYWMAWRSGSKRCWKHFEGDRTCREGDVANHHVVEQRNVGLTGTAALMLACENT